LEYFVPTDQHEWDYFVSMIYLDLLRYGSLEQYSLMN